MPDAAAEEEGLESAEHSEEASEEIATADEEAD